MPNLIIQLESCPRRSYSRRTFRCNKAKDSYGRETPVVSWPYEQSGYLGKMCLGKWFSAPLTLSLVLPHFLKIFSLYLISNTNAINAHLFLLLFDSLVK